MPLFRRKPPTLPLRMPRIDGSSWPDRRDVERRSFAALTLYQMGYREAFEPEAATIADRLAEEVLPMFLIDSAPGDAPYLRQVFVSAAQMAPESGSWIGGPRTPTSGASTERSGGRCGRPSANSRRCLRSCDASRATCFRQGITSREPDWGRSLGCWPPWLTTTRAEAKGTAGNCPAPSDGTTAHPGPGAAPTT